MISWVQIKYFNLLLKFNIYKIKHFIIANDEFCQPNVTILFEVSNAPLLD